MDKSPVLATSSSKLEEYDIRLVKIVFVFCLMVVIIFCVLVFCMMKANRGSGENSNVGFRATKIKQLQCRHTCFVNNNLCNSVFDKTWNRDRHEMNLNVHPNCQNSQCTCLSYHHLLGIATAQVEHLKADGPPLAKRRASVGASVSRTSSNNNDADDGDEPEFEPTLKRPRSSLVTPKLSNAEVVLNNAVALIKSLQPRSGARRPLIATLFDGVTQVDTASLLGVDERTVRRAVAGSRVDGKISNRFFAVIYESIRWRFR